MILDWIKRQSISGGTINKIGVEDKNKMKNNEYLSVKQFSERAGVSSQAVYKQLNNKLKKFKKVENGKTYVNIRGLSCFVATNSTNVVQPVEQLSTNVEQQVEMMIELLKEQLKAKDEQIRALNEQLKAKDETLKNAMRITENTQILLKNQQEKSMPAIEEKHKEQLDQEKKEQLNEIEKLKNELEKEKNKGFFARLFSK